MRLDAYIEKCRKQDDPLRVRLKYNFVDFSLTLI